MKTTLRYLRLNAQASWHRLLEQQLNHLHGLTPITATEVILEHQRETKPAFRVRVRLDVPGPGLHAEATRHTRRAALRIPGPALHTEARDNTLGRKAIWNLCRLNQDKSSQHGWRRI
ncbi:MAG: hypothetical protein HY735_36065 [Verrucomicrobia bacterium]|nr:hypothetical protein [Verrucomicrobiota bacterium]